MSMIDVVKVAHEALQAAVPGLRRTARKTEGRLAEAYREAMQIMDRQKADGVPFMERMKGLDAVLRAVWPFTREWHYVCQECHDTGLVMLVCQRGNRCDGISTRTDGPNQQPGKYLRFCGKDPDGEYEHDYGRACYCSLGARFRSRPKPTPDDFQSAGKSKFTRVGR
jgi:hypothetical protein